MTENRTFNSCCLSESVRVEEVRQSNVYTKGGDKGMTSLVTGERRRKTDIVFETEGILDELNSNVGQARAMLINMVENYKETNLKCQANVKNASQLIKNLEDIQQWIMNVTAVVSTPIHGQNDVEPRVLELLAHYDFIDEVHKIENEIDVIDARLTPLRIFILPGGGNVASAQLHVCRTVCRRAERRMVDVRDKYGEQYTDHLRQATVYVNRLSDYFFVAARSVAEEDIVRKSEEGTEVTSVNSCS